LRNILLWLEEWKQKFKGFTVEYIDRNKNSEANELRKVATRNNPLLVDVFSQTIPDASIKQNQVRAQSDQHNTG
jgi:hypothetical protein